MPGLGCKCGYRISYGEIPCSDEYLFISDTEFESHWDKELDTQKLYEAMNGFLKCPTCGRLWIFWNGYQKAAQEFLPVQNEVEQDL
jgi:hypothetical protein